MIRLGSIVLGGLLGACTMGAPSPAPEVPGPEEVGGGGSALGDRLVPGVQVDLMSERGLVSCTVQVRDQIRHGEVEIEGGAVMLSLGAGHVLDVQAIDVVLGDLPLEEHVEDPMMLKDVAASWVPTSPVETIWSGESRVYGTATGTLTVSWTLSTRDGHLIELADQELFEVALDLEAALDAEGRVAVSAAGQVPGTFFEWAGLVELTDLSFELAGLSAPGL